MTSKNKFEICGEDIHILRKEWNKIAFTTYREDYYEELSSVTWTEKNGYLYNTKFGLLHRYIMEKWYGKEMLEDMSKAGWIVDHMNNDGFDNRIFNLEFLTSRHNVAKGQTLDVESKEMQSHIALNLFKDFTTNCYQITIAFNDNVYWMDEKKQPRLINSLYLLYDCDYRQVIIDAEKILLDYSLEKQCKLTGLKCVDYKCEFPPEIILTPQELEEIEHGRCFVEREGKQYLILSEHVKMVSAHYKKGWKPK